MWKNKTVLKILHKNVNKLIDLENTQLRLAIAYKR